MSSVILQLFPAQLDVNGDAQNARVLAQRARWAGIDAEVVPVQIGAIAPAAAPSIVVVGSSVDSELTRLRDALEPLAEPLREWIDAGVPVLAIGTGFELLSGGIRADGLQLEGLALLPGLAQPLPQRATDDLVVESEWGRLIGYENHARGILLPAGARALGTVTHGVGNDSRSEGARSGSAIGTHLHGPVLAKNPVLADALLTAAFGDAYSNADPRIVRVDEIARAARDQIAKRLEL